MPYLIDASNVGGTRGGATGARDAEGVVRWLQEWARSRGRVVVVFDGAPSPRLAERYGPLEVVWSGAGRSADDEIVRRLAGPARDWIVVTDDRELGRRCREAGAVVEPAATLRERVERPHPNAVRAPEPGDKPPLTPAERSYWEKVFGGGRE